MVSSTPSAKKVVIFNYALIDVCIRYIFDLYCAQVGVLVKLLTHVSTFLSEKLAACAQFCNQEVMKLENEARRILLLSYNCNVRLPHNSII